MSEGEVQSALTKIGEVLHGTLRGKTGVFVSVVIGLGNYSEEGHLKLSESA